MSNLINSIGLCVDIIGATIIFCNTPEKTFTTYLYQKHEYEKLNAEAKRIRDYNRIGFALLGVGFVLQLVSNFM